MSDCFRFYNPNPAGRNVGDCTVRAISLVTGQDWEKTYMDLCLQGYMMCDLPSANSVWGAYLRGKGFCRKILPDECPDCYKVEDFCADHPFGVFLLALSGHVAAVVNGELYDTWDSSDGIPLYYWEKGKDD